MKVLTLRRGRRGQSLVEFAFVVPVFLGVLIGLAVTSILFYSYVTLHLAVREGASAIVHDPRNQTVTAIQNLVRSKSFSLDQNQLSVLVEPSDKTLWVSGVQVSVSASYNVPLPEVTIPLIGSGAITFGSIPIRAQSVMTIE